MINHQRLFLFLLAFIALSPITLLAQGPPPPPEAREEIETMKIGFITRRLSLTPDEAKVFWPVYDQYADELRELREAHRSRMRSVKDDNEVSKEEWEKLADVEIQFRQQELDIMKKFHVQFKKILPPRKVAALYRAEEDFKRELIEKIREGRKGGPPPGHHRPR
jgi:Spy/CpxP family protein refolding chaperone